MLLTGVNGGMALRDGVDASGRKGKVSLSLLFTSPFSSLKKSFLILKSSCFQGKGVYQYVDKYGANVDGYR